MSMPGGNSGSFSFPNAAGTFINSNLYTNIPTQSYVGNNWGVNPGSEVYNPALDYLGVFRPEGASPASDDEWVRNFQGPRAYAGKSKFVGRFIYGLLLRNIDWATDPIHGFPMRETNDRTFEWEVLKFNEVVSPILPHEAPTRLAKSSSERGSATMIRRGFGMLWEHDWLKTPIGQQYWFWNLQQIVNATTLAIYYDVIRALLQTRVKWVEQLRSNGLLHGINRQNMLLEYSGMAFAPHKSSDALQALVDHAKAGFRNIGVEPRTIIVPGGYGYHFRGLGPENIEYWRAGPAGPALKDVDAEQIRSFRGLTIIQTRARDVKAFMQFDEDALVRKRYFGEHYITMGPSVSQMDEERLRNFMSAEMSFQLHVPNTYRTLSYRDFLLNYRFYVNDRYFEEPNGAITRTEYLGENDGNGGPTGLLFAKQNRKQYVEVLGEIHPAYLSNEHLVAMAKQMEMRVGGGLKAYVAAAPVEPGFDPRRVEEEEADEVRRGGSYEEYSNLSPVYEAYLSDPHPDLSSKAEVDARIALLLRSSDPEAAVEEKFTKPASVLLNPYALRPERAAAIDALLNLPKLERKAPAPATVGQWIPKSAVRPDHVHLDPSTNKPLPAAKFYTKAERTRFNEVGVRLRLDREENEVMLASAGSAPYPNKFLFGSFDNIDLPPSRLRMMKDAQDSDYAEELVQLLMMPVDLQNLLWLDENNILPPFEFLSHRAYMEFLTSSMIMALNGEGTGSTLFANPDWMVQDDALTKMHQASWSLEHTTVIWKSENVRVFDDIFIRDYQGGRNEKFFTRENLDDLKAAMYTPPESLDRPSLVCTPVPYGTSRKLQEVISACGWFDQSERDDVEKRHFITTSHYYDQFASAGTEFAHLESQDPDTPANIVLYQGHQRCYNPSVKDGHRFNAIRSGGPSHLGKNIYNDVILDMKDRKGGLQKEMNYEGQGWISAESL